ncbi:MAG: glycosyltransferase family 2 protein [Marinilabiliaceae bacterium]|nr:glycosyltransferase family 2 protein [Marinilabiliaceae bacterium]
MFVSIIITVYNAGRFLEETLNSVFQQTYPHLEIICVNDGSTDNSNEILQHYKNKIKIINQPNQGQCAASNAGLKIATGEYIKFFDADDLMNPEHIELQVKKLNGRTDAIASCEWGRFYDGNPQNTKFIPEPVWKDMEPLKWLKTALAQKADMMGAPLWLIPRQLLEKTGGWDERLSLNNDFEFITRLLLHCKEVLFTKGAKIYYRSGRAGSLANSANRKAFEAALLSTDLGCQHLLERENSPIIRLLCANRYQTWAYRIYPHFPDLVNKVEKKIISFGGSTNKIEGGRFFKLMRDLFGWKCAKKVQSKYHQLRTTLERQN